MADFIKSRIKVTSRTDRGISFEVESFHSYNDPSDSGASFHFIKKGDYEDAVDTASKVVANATGGLVTKGFSKKSNNREKLSLYAHCIEEASHLFDEMGYGDIGNSLRKLSTELKAGFDKHSDDMHGNIQHQGRSLALIRTRVFSETSANSILPFSYLPAHNYGETVGNVRNSLKSMFEAIASRNVITNGNKSLKLGSDSANERSCDL